MAGRGLGGDYPAGLMPRRATARGAERTPIDGDHDVVVCGASFAGLAVARELAGARTPDGRRPDVLVLDRYEIGERQTSACAAPTAWLRALGLEGAIVQTFRSMVVTTPRRRARWPLPASFSTFDYRELCRLLADRGDFTFATATVQGRADEPITVRTDRGDVRAPLVVDALGWRRVLAREHAPIQPPDAWLSRGLEVHPGGSGRDLELVLGSRYLDPGYGWSFPAGDEVRVGIGSFDPRRRVREPTARLAADLERGADEGWQGNWIPHRLRPAVDDGVLCVGDSAGHCLPTTAEGIRPALYFGLAAGRELAAVLEGRQTRAQALRRYAAFSAEHARWYRWLLAVQRAVGHVVPRERLTAGVVDALVGTSLGHAGWRRYLDLAPASFVHEGAAGRPSTRPRAPRAQPSPEPSARAA